MYKNWEIKSISTNDGGKGVNPCIVHEEYRLIIRIPHKSLNVFGYCVAGCELGIIEQTEKGSKYEQLVEILEIVTNELLIKTKEPNFWDVKNYLKNYKGKRKMGLFVKPSKKIIESIKNVLAILNENWQELNKIANNRDIAHLDD
jgi:hypothetical protein